MNTKSICPFVYFPKGFLEAINSKSEFEIWISFQNLIKQNAYKEGGIDGVSRYYNQLLNNGIILRTQLKFYLMRSSFCKACKEYTLTELIRRWYRIVEPYFPLNTFIVSILMESMNKNSLTQYGKYFYNPSQYVEYAKKWNDKTVELLNWKDFEFLLIPGDINFLQPVFEKHGGLSFSEEHMKKLFNKYVGEIYKTKFKPRLENTIIKEKEKSILDRIINNAGSKDDKLYLKNVLGIGAIQTVSTDLSKCLTNDISLVNIDINSTQNYSVHFALIRYYEALLGKSEKPQKKNNAMWFRNMPTNKNDKETVYESLHDVFDIVNKYCDGTSWRDFKSIFNKNTVNTKIVWTGNPSILNLIFRKLHKELQFEGGKWDVITFYFIPNKNDRFNPNALRDNSHYKNLELENLLDLLCSTLSK